MIIVVDCETTGLIAGHHDIIQIAAIAVEKALRPNKEVMPFVMKIKPKNPDRADPKSMQVNRVKIEDRVKDGVDPYKAADMFEAWCKRLNAGKVIALGQNHPFDRGFMQEWMGHIAYGSIFDHHFLDTCCSAQYLNDRADYNGLTKPFLEGISLGKLCDALGIEKTGAHDALQDCLLTLQVYRKMMTVVMV